MTAPLALASRRWIRAALAGVAVAGVLAACSPALSGGPPRPIVTRLPDGRKLNFRCAGQGGPTVVFESGWGADSGAWVKVLPMVATSRRACAYDRAGYGASDPGPDPRDATAIVSDLHAGLRSARIRGPYILVGHSAGGLYARLFAAKYPKEVVGLVLVDPSIEHQDARYASVFGPGAGSIAPFQQRSVRCLAAAQDGRLPSNDPALSICTPAGYAARPGALVGLWEAEGSEIDNLFTTASDEVQQNARTLDDLPLVVLTAGGASSDSSPSLVFWAQLHREIAATSRRGSARLVEHTTHLMMFQRPDAIVSAIDDVAAAAARGQ